jgi:site-specific recombinase XerD
MTLDHLTNNKIQIGGVSGLDHLTISKNLESQLDVFLLSCRVDGLSIATLRNYSYQLGQFVAFCFQAGLKDAHDITTHHVRAFLLSLQEKNNPISVHDYYGSINRFFNWMVEEGILPQNPMRNIKPPRMPKLTPKPFSRRDIDNLLLLCSGNRFLEVRNRALVFLFLDTGLRLSEAANIQLKDIDFERETIKVMGKGAKERRVRIGKTTQKTILRYLLMRSDNLPCLWVTEERRPLTVAGVQIAIKKLCYRAEITDAKRGPHTFRHTAAINYLRNGGTEFTLQIMLGHSTLQMTRKYVSSLSEEDMFKAHRLASPVDNLGIK